MSQPAAPVAPAPKRGRTTRIVVIALAAVLVAVVGAGAIYTYTINRSVSQNIHRADTLPGANPSDASPSVSPDAKGALNYLLLGSDSRDPSKDSSGRSDTIMLVHLDKAHDKAYITSFPRDMYVDIPGHGKDKINAAYALGGPQLTVQTLENLTGVRIDHVVLVDFSGFIKLTNDLGGVSVTNKTEFTSHGYSYPKGKITISGAKALWFVRERDALPNGDLGRAENQRNVIKAIITKGLSAGVVSDPTRFTGFLGNLAKNLTVDQTLTDADIRNTALSLRLTANDIALLQAPLSGFATIGGQSVDLVDQAKFDALSRALRDDTVNAYLRQYPNG